MTRAAPRVGDTFDLNVSDARIHPDRPRWPVIAWADDDMLGALEARGYFDHFRPDDRARARAAVESLNQAEFEVHLLGEGELTPVRLFDIVVTAVQIALTGRSDQTDAAGASVDVGESRAV